MKVIGITGGIGSGKSAVMDYLREHYNCVAILSDEVAHLVKHKGTACYDRLVELLGEQVLDETGEIDKQKMAEAIFSSQELLAQVNALIHPAVKAYFRDEIAKEKAAGRIDFFFLEAALLIEEKYDEIADELWYIYADESVRRERLKASRHYSDEKIDAIMHQQLSDEEFRAHCKVTIPNNGNLVETYRTIDRYLEQYIDE